LAYHYGEFRGLGPGTAYDTIMVSGGFDPIHVGHVRMIYEAAQYAGVIVVINSDDWLMRKKGYVFMPFEERREIIESIKGVIRVEHVDDSDETVCEALCRLKPTYFANGGDRTNKNTPEMDICKKLGITMLWEMGGKNKVQSSSELVEKSHPHRTEKEEKGEETTPVNKKTDRPVC